MTLEVPPLAAIDSIAPVVVLLLIAAAGFAVAVWFGLRIVAPRLGRAMDRADADDISEEPGDD